MTCKNCGKELEAEEIICTRCAFDNSQEPEETGSQKINPWKIAFPTVVSLGLLLVLGWLLFYGVTGYWIPRANDIYYRDNYTVSEEKLLAGRNNVVATAGKHKLTNAQFQVFYSRACYDNQNKYSAGTPLNEQYYSEEAGLTWQQYLLELALNTWKQYTVLTDMAMEEGFQLPEEYQQSLDTLEESLSASAEKSGYSSVDALLSADVCKGCTYADYRYFVELNYYANLYFEELAEKIEVSQEEVDAFFAENKENLEKAGITKESGKLVDLRNIYIKAEGDLDEITTEQWDTCKDSAQDILDQWLEMGTTEENFSELASENSQDNSSKGYGGLMRYIYKNYLTEVDIRHILIQPEGGTKSEDGKTTTYSETEWEECRKKAQAIYDEYLNGTRTETNFALLAKEHSEDGNAADGGIYLNVEKNSMVAEFDEWIFDENRQPGDTGLVKTQFGYHVMYFVHRDDAMDSWIFDSQRKYGDYALIQTDTGYQVTFFVEADEGWIRVSRDTVKGEKADELLVELGEQHTISVKYSKIRLGE